VVDCRLHTASRQGTLKVSPSTRIIHQVIEPYGDLDACATDATSPSDTEDDHERRDLFKSPNHQRVRELSSMVYQRTR
jgi:hypothetical protein